LGVLRVPWIARQASDAILRDKEKYMKNAVVTINYARI
jgi:hypothetical protein